MIYITKDDRDIFTILINYKHSLASELSSFRFLLAHIAEHLVLTNACRQLQQICTEAFEIEKFISGLTSAEHTTFQLIASNNYISYVKDVLDSINNHNLEYISEADLCEQKKCVLSEYEYTNDSFYGCCNRFFRLINDFEDIDIEQALNNITLSDIKTFIEKSFVKEHCTVIYVGSYVNNLRETVAACRIEMDNNTLFHDSYNKYNCQFPSIQLKTKDKMEVWFGYCRAPVRSIQEYYENEIISKVLQFMMLLSNRDSIENFNLKNVGTQYSSRYSYSLYCANTFFKDINFNCSKDKIPILIDSVICEYKTRIYIKLDSLSALAKEIKKIYLLTGEVRDKLLDYIEILDSINQDELCDELVSIKKSNSFAVMQYQPEEVL